jgi:transcriptional regulator with XRE-family HTH domain
MTDINKAVSNSIKLLREAKGYSQSYMAQKLHVTQQAYSAMEITPENMSLKRLHDVADLLQVDVVTLLDIDINTQHNFNKQGGIAKPNMVNQQTVVKNVLYQRLIAQLTDEIVFLKSQL